MDSTSSPVYWSAIGDCDGGEQIERTIPVDKIGLTLETVQQSSLIFAVDHSDDFPAFEGKQTDVIRSLPAHNALVVDHGSGIPEDWANAAVTLKNFDRLPNGTYGHLSRQAEALPEFPVAALVDGLLVEDTVSEGDRGGIRRSGIEGPHGVKQAGTLDVRRDKAELQGQFHRLSIGYIQSVSKRNVALTSNFRFLSRLKGGVSTKGLL